MDRFHVWIEKEHTMALKILSKKTGKNRSELIREAIDLLIVQKTEMIQAGGLSAPTPLQNLTEAVRDQANEANEQQRKAS
jgi:hypothetical protein